MLYVLLILLIIAAVIFVALWSRVTVEIHLKDSRLKIVIGNRFIKKKLDIDLKKEKPQKAAKKCEPKENKPTFKDRLSEMKKRIFNPETGFDKEEAIKVKDELLGAYSDTIEILRKIFGKMRYKVHIPKTYIRLDYGTGDPADTGMIYGAIWGAVGVLYPIAARYVHMAYPMIDITPDFYEKRFSAEIRSIIKVRPAHIINASFSSLMGLLVTYLKNKKGRGKNVR